MTLPYSSFVVRSREWETLYLRQTDELLLTGPYCTCDFPPGPPLKGLDAYCSACQASVHSPRFLTLTPMAGREAMRQDLEAYLLTNTFRPILELVMEADEIAHAVMEASAWAPPMPGKIEP